MLQGSLQKIDFQDLLPNLTFQLRDPRLLRPFLTHTGKRPLPKLIHIAAPAVQLLAVHFQTARHYPRRLTRAHSLQRIEFELLAELPSRPHPSFPFRCILGLNWLSQNRGPLHGEPAYSIATIASRAGKSEAYVYGRVRLADLIPPVAEAFLKDQITIGHALLIAKLPASQQQEAFSAAFRGLWTSEGNSQVLIPVRELAAWIESNILLQLASAPFDKQDETLVPEAGLCANCPKRTGFNKLLFPDVRKDSCTSPDCFRAKIDASVKKTLETKPQLVQISAAWNSREGAPLGRNKYVELEIRKPKTNGATSKVSVNQKPCEKMAEAIVMDGGKRGQFVKVCADPACRTHHPNTPSPQQVERERAEERKRIENEKLAITTRHRILATILQRVSAPLKKADLLAVAHYLIGRLSYSQVPALAKRHKVEAKKDSASAQGLLAKQVSTYDEAELGKLLLEISLLDSAYQRSTSSRDDVLMDAAKRYRVDTEKLQKAVAKEFAVKRDKKTAVKPKARSKTGA